MEQSRLLVTFVTPGIRTEEAAELLADIMEKNGFQCVEVSVVEAYQIVGV